MRKQVQRQTVTCPRTHRWCQSWDLTLLLWDSESTHSLTHTPHTLTCPGLAQEWARTPLAGTPLVSWNQDLRCSLNFRRLPGPSPLWDLLATVLQTALMFGAFVSRQPPPCLLPPVKPGREPSRWRLKLLTTDTSDSGVPRGLPWGGRL